MELRGLQRTGSINVAELYATTGQEREEIGKITEKINFSA